MPRIVERRRGSGFKSRVKRLCWLAGMAALAAGCATHAPNIRLSGDIMVDAPLMITNGPAQDRVLWQERLAIAEMRRGQFSDAKRLLDDALLTVGGIARDESAKLARSYFHPESTKKFIGEPYERVMLYYYRGILYWMDGEPDNARACFRSAALQDADAENHQYAADYALLDYLDGLATTKLGGDGSDAFRRSEQEAHAAKPPPADASRNVLFFLEFGPGPFKYGTGQYREELRFGATASPVHSADVEVDGTTASAGPIDDLYFQATTRGGRVMDHILANKAVFKTSTDVAGTVGIVGGAMAAMQHDRTTQQVGLGLLAAGVITKIVSATTTPAADTRAWNNLPRYLSFAAFQLSPGQHTATVTFKTETGAVVPSFTKTITFDVPSNGKDKVLFVSDQSSTPQTL